MLRFLLGVSVAGALFVSPALAFCGKASWYSYTGHRTANGELFNGKGYTAASKTLPFGTRLLVTYHQHSVVVRINDRGPYIPGRILDLSEAAARDLGLIPAGADTVCAEILPSS